MMTNWFLSLSASQAIGVVFFGSIIGACIVVMIYNALSNVGRYNFAAIHADEFEYMDDPYAILCYPNDPMRDDIHVEHAKEVLQQRAFVGAPQISITNSTCMWCKDVEHCPFSFDPYNMDGDCLMTK